MNNKKKIILGSIIGVLIGTLISVSYAFFTFSKTSNNNSQLVVGDIYMKYTGNNELDFEGAMPSSTYTEGKYFEFEVSGKNTTTNKDIYYDIVINHGIDNPKSRTTRIEDKFLKFRLVEVVEENNVRQEVTPDLIEGKSYNEINNTRIYVRTIPKNTTTEIKHIYRLYAWIDQSVVISNNGGDYTPAEWANLYASIRVDVTGDFNEKEVYRELTPIERAIKNKEESDSNCKDKTIWTDSEDGIIYISGDKDCIDFNYLWYSGKMWRIIAIYPDGAMKLVTDNNITSISFNESNQVNFYTSENTKSYMYQWLNEDFYDTLYNASNIIDTTKFWNATMVGGNDISVKPGTSNLVTANVGLLNSYEYYNSYRNVDLDSKGYLKMNYNWWLLNPYSSSTVRNEAQGYNPSMNSVPTTAIGVRPSINLKSEISITGTGVKTDPFKIVGDITSETENQMVNTRISGEYVKIKYKDVNQEDTLSSLYRIVGIEKSPLDDTKMITKLVAMDYANNGANMKFATADSNGNGTIYGSGTTVDSNKTTWYSYLNGTDKNSVHNNDGWFDGLGYKDLLTKGTYYMGDGDKAPKHNYKGAICKTSDINNKIKLCNKTANKGIFNVGLLRYGEMFATQQASDSSSLAVIWLITKTDLSFVRSVGTFAGADIDYSRNAANRPTKLHSVRPTVNLKSTVKILSGSGTELDPFVVGL